MTSPTPPTSREEGSWAKPVSGLRVPTMPLEALNLNVEGRHVSGPLQGFGQLWQKTFRVRLSGVRASPVEVMKTWKENFPKFHATENKFYLSKIGVAPGQVLLINAMTPGGPVATGMMVLYADDESFTLMTPEGHPESGWVTFSAFEQDGATVAQVQTMARANDPVYEAAFMTVGSKLQDSIWTNLLKGLAAHFGIDGVVQVQKMLVDPKRQWSRAGNVWKSAQIRTMLYVMTAPVRWVGRLFKRQSTLGGEQRRSGAGGEPRQESLVTRHHHFLHSPEKINAMTTPAPQLPREEGSWARPVDKLKVLHAPTGALNLNVDGRHLTGLLKGFGQLWQKTYKVRLSGIQVTPQEVIAMWKDNFGKFWPKVNRFYAPLAGIQAGEVAVLNLAGPGGVTGPGGSPVISTGIMVIYTDDESFSFMTPEGHILSGMITFSAYEEEGATVAQVQALFRPNDPLYEMSFRMGIGHKTEDDHWHHTLKALAAHYGVDGTVQQQQTIVDPRIQWREAGNIWKNAAIRTAFHLPGHLIRGLFGRK